MKHFATLIILLFVGFAQAQVPTQPASPAVEKEAKRLVDTYNKTLALNGVQLPLFKNKVEEYLTLVEEARRDLEGKEELDAIVEIQANETLQMKNILTQNQLEIYKQMKVRVQPLKVIEDKE